MERQFIELGSAPTEEPILAYGVPGYGWRIWHETRAYVNQLRRLFGPEPWDSTLTVGERSHPDGRGLVVRFRWGKSDPAGDAYAKRCLHERPSHWDAEARAELGLDRPPEKPAKVKRPRMPKASSASADAGSHKDTSSERREP
jgi:hypothetical protein